MQFDAAQLARHERLVKTNTHSGGGECKMPLTLAEVGEGNVIRKIGGRQEVRTHLANLGFVVGGVVTVVSAIGGNVIVNVKGSRIAVSREMAQKIMV